LEWIDGLGYLAGILTTFSAFPQLYYSYTARDVASIDLKFLLMLAGGLFLWGVYGLMIVSWPIVFFNFIGTALWLPIVVMKIKTLKNT
jgi:MtN3 and saliva related transmembrane protein